MYRFGDGSLLLIFHSSFAGRTQLTGEREKCYLVGLEASGWGMGGKKGTKGSYPEARPANGERPTDAPFPAVPLGHPTLVVVETPNACCCLRTYCSEWAGCSTLFCCVRIGIGAPTSFAPHVSVSQQSSVARSRVALVIVESPWWRVMRGWYSTQ